METIQIENIRAKVQQYLLDRLSVVRKVVTSSREHKSATSTYTHHDIELQAEYKSKNKTLTLRQLYDQGVAHEGFLRTYCAEELQIIRDELCEDFKKEVSLKPNFFEDDPYSLILISENKFIIDIRDFIEEYFYNSDIRESFVQEYEKNINELSKIFDEEKKKAD